MTESGGNGDLDLDQIFGQHIPRVVLPHGRLIELCRALLSADGDGAVTVTLHVGYCAPVAAHAEIAAGSKRILVIVPDTIPQQHPQIGLITDPTDALHRATLGTEQDIHDDAIHAPA